MTPSLKEDHEVRGLPLEPSPFSVDNIFLWHRVKFRSFPRAAPGKKVCAPTCMSHTRASWHLHGYEVVFGCGPAVGVIVARAASSAVMDHVSSWRVMKPSESSV